ncbi:MAG: hypothetical protein ACMG6E_03205 [Candidatus Roizmanbacteria bacterium]
MGSASVGLQVELVLLDPLQQVLPLSVLQIESVALHDEGFVHDIILDVEQPHLLFLVGVQLLQATAVLNTASFFLDSVPAGTQRPPVLLHLEPVSHLLLVLEVVVQVLLGALAVLGSRRVRVVGEAP